MSLNPKMYSRRVVLSSTFIGGMAAALAACSGSSTPAASTSAASTSAAATSASATESATETASASASATDKAVTRANADLVIWCDANRAKALKDIAAKFGTDNGITVAVQEVANELQTSFVTADTSGNGPDIVIGAHDWIGNMVQNGSIAPVQINETIKADLSPIALAGVTYSGQTYGMPYAIETLVLFRNKALAPEAPKSFDALAATGLQLVKDKKADRPLSLQIDQTGDAYAMHPLYTSAGGYLFGKNPDGSLNANDVGVGGPGSLKFGEMLKKYGEKGEGVLNRSVTGSNAISLFTGGKIPYLFSGPWAVADIKKAKVDYAISEIPGFEGLNPAKPFVGVQSFFVAAHGKNKAFAEQFVDEVAGAKETQLALYGVEPRPPASKSALAQVAATDADTALIAKAAEAGEPMPSIPAMAAIWKPVGQAEANIVGGEDPATAIAAAATAIKTALK